MYTARCFTYASQSLACSASKQYYLTQELHLSRHLQNRIEAGMFFREVFIYGYM